MQDPLDESDVRENGAERPKGAEGVIFDIARKAVAGSVRSLLSSEEGLRALIGAMVPREIGQTIMRELSTQMATLRTEAVNAVVAEFSAYLSRLDPSVEIQRILSGLDFDVHVKIGINRKEEARPAGKARPANRKPRAKKKATSGK